MNKKRVGAAIAAGVAVLGAAVVIGGLFSRVSRLEAEITVQNSAVLDEIGKNNETLELLVGDVMTIGRYTAKAAAETGVPAGPLRLLEAEKERDAAAERAQQESFTPYFQAADRLETHRRQVRQGRVFRQFWESLPFFDKPEPGEGFLTVETTGPVTARILLKEHPAEAAGSGFTVAEARYKGSPGEEGQSGDSFSVVLTSFRGESLETASTQEPALERFLAAEKAAAAAKLLGMERSRKQLASLLKAPDITAAAEEKGVELTAGKGPELYRLTAGDGILLGRLSQDPAEGGLSWNGKPCDSPAAAAALIRSRLDGYDPRTPGERRVDRALEILETLRRDRGFISYLDGKGWRAEDRGREDEDYHYLDLINAGGERVGALAVLKKLGGVYLVDEDDVVIASLDTITAESSVDSPGPLELPEEMEAVENLYSNEESFTMLLAGAHERNTDTLIVVHADKASGEYRMISLPRDLYYKGRKINSIYKSFGGEQLKKELSAILGLAIDKYAVIDMYAFIDAVNILGGIDVTLQHDLVDPSYKVKDNGRWSTLYYEAGTHHLDGIEALRVARSRHTTSDFGRAERQQLIIQSLKERVADMGVSDAGTLYKLATSLTSYVDTDLAPVEAAALFMSFGNTAPAGNYVINTFNVLYHTYSAYGEWILLPADDDWNVIKWYVRQILAGEV